jgi:uncharacterized protein YndB with AHSA1/START domain
VPSYNTSTTISRPVSDVFQYLSDVTGWSNWMNVDDVHPVTPGDIRRVGARAEGLLREGSRRTAVSFEVTEFQSDRRIAFKTTSGPIDWSGSWEVRALNDVTTEVLAQGVLRLRGIRRLLEPLMAGEIRKAEAAELAKLRSILERSGNRDD